MYEKGGNDCFPLFCCQKQSNADISSGVDLEHYEGQCSGNCISESLLNI